jgi:hypothetical protein
MRRRHHAVLVIAFLLIGTRPALAQNGAEVTAGWRDLYIGGSEGADGQNVPIGWYADVAVPFKLLKVGTLASFLVADVSGHYHSEDATETVPGVGTITGSADSNVHTFMGGLRLSGVQNPRLRPFAQVLFGVGRASTSLSGTATVGGLPPVTFEDSFAEADAALSIGGGVNVAAGTLTVRLQAEWLKILVEDSGNAFRFGVGVLIPLRF